MKTACKALIVALALIAVTAVGEELHVRLVTARVEGEMDAELRDIAKLLGQLPFKGFDLVKSERFSLPSNAKISLDSGLEIQLTGPQDNLTVIGRQGDKPLLKTTIGLKTDRPFITVLPVSFENGKILLVIVAREG